METNLHATVVSHTHWDRAWYITFQEFRARLVRLIDRLLGILENHPDYRVYTLDGQMSVLEDYLEVRPQKSAQLQALCRAGRITVGPWYVLADEFLVSPEALIRNLMLGHKMGAEYGGVTKLGYVPDGFGHIAQLPQILRGFGVDNAFFWRGMGNEGEKLGAEFEWRALDGSTVTAIWMPFGYHDISNIGYPIHWGDTSQMEFDPDLAVAQIRKALAALQPFVHTPARLLMNGIDHAEAEPRLPQILAQAAKEVAGVEFHHGTLLEHLARVRAAQLQLSTFEGEFRWGCYSEILQGVYSTRIYLKQINHRVETLLERYAEPLMGCAWLSGANVPDGMQDLRWTAWRWLLKNHPHDDIYGSGIDQVHDEMLFRFSQAEQIGQILVRDSWRQLARQIDFTARPGVPLLIFNPLGWERREVAVGEIDFDFDDPTADNFTIVDGQGNRLPCQILSDEPIFWMETLKANRKRRVKVAFHAEVPACGYRAYFAQPLSPSEREAPGACLENIGTTVPHRKAEGAENSFLSFTFTPDGGLDLTDKVTGHTYRGLHHFYDVEDAGDEYSYCPVEHSQTFSTVEGEVNISRIAEGENLVTFRVERLLSLPESLTADRKRRSEMRVEIPIVSEITLYRDQRNSSSVPGLYIRTEIENRARDHKLSVVFPTDLSPAFSSVDAAFAVMPRPIELPEASGWVEDPTSLMHQRAFTDLSENGRGLAVLNRGLPAVEVIRETEGAQIWLTLLRSVGWLSRDDLSNRRVAAGPLVPTLGAQCLGRYVFEYAILPHAGDWRAVYPVAYNYLAPLLLARADTHEGLELKDMNITRDDPAQVKSIPWPRGGQLPEMLSFVEIQPQNLVLSAVKRSEDGESLIVRFYNIERVEIAARITTGFPLRAAYRLNLNEERVSDLPLRGKHKVELTVKPAEVVTIELRPV